MAVKKKLPEPISGLSGADKAAAFLEQFRRTSGVEICPASEYQQMYLKKRHPTGLLTLDVALRGGFPAAAVSQIIGEKNSGKSYLYWRVIAELQRIKGADANVLLGMTEMVADKTQAHLAGAAVALAEEDIAYIERARAHWGMPVLTDEERARMRFEVGQIHEMHAESGEALYDIILAAVEQNTYDIIIVDSIGALMTLAQAEADTMEQKFYGGTANLNARFLAKLTMLLASKMKDGATRDTSIILVNQVRENLLNPKAPYKAPGGRALDHHKFVDLYVSSRAMETIETSIPVHDGVKRMQQAIGKEIVWKIEKGKGGMHEGAVGTFFYDFRIGGADLYRDALAAGRRYGVIEQTGAWFELPGTTLRAQGIDKFVEALAEDTFHPVKGGSVVAPDGTASTFLEEIRRRVYQKEQITVMYGKD